MPARSTFSGKKKTLSTATAARSAVEPSAVKEALLRHGVRPLQMLTLAITGDCNLSCRHCLVDARPAPGSSGLPIQQLRRLVEELGVLGGSGLRLTGGEPLRHPGWLELMRLARSLGLDRLILQTNAMLLGDGDVAALGELDFPGLAIEISLDGATAPSHDLVRGEGAFAGALAGIRRLVHGGLSRRISLMFTEMRHNLGEFPALLELAADLGIPSVIAGTLVQGGRAATDAHLFPPSLDQYLRLLRHREEDQRFRELYASIGTMAALEWRQEDAPRTEACTFVENPYLSPDGRLYPCLMCHVDDFSVSGVGAKGLAASLIEGAPLWASLARLSRQRSEANSACRECPWALLCAGGCMGRAWGSCGNLLAADDRCSLRRAIYRHDSSSRS